MVKHFLWCFGESQGVTIAFFDCIGRCVGTAPPTPRFAASTCGWRTLALGGFRRSALPSVSAFAAGRVDLRAHDFRFSARTASGLPSAGWFFCLPLRSCRSAGWSSGSLLPLFGTHRFGVALVGLVFTPSVSELPLGELAFGLLLPFFGMRRFGVAAGRVRSSTFRFGVAARRVGLWAHGFRFSARTASGLPLGELVLPPSASEIALGGLAFGLIASEIAIWRVGLWAHGFGNSARRVGLRAHCFRFSACTDPHRRTAEARTDGAHRHDTCFTSKHLSQHVNLPHRTP